MSDNVLAKAAKIRRELQAMLARVDKIQRRVAGAQVKIAAVQLKLARI